MRCPSCQADHFDASEDRVELSMLHPDEDQSTAPAGTIRYRHADPNDYCQKCYDEISAEDASEREATEAAHAARMEKRMRFMAPRAVAALKAAMDRRAASEAT